MTIDPNDLYAFVFLLLVFIFTTRTGKKQDSEMKYNSAAAGVYLAWPTNKWKKKYQQQRKKQTKYFLP